MPGPDGVEAPREHRRLAAPARERSLGEDHGLGPARPAPVVGVAVAEVLGADRADVPALVERVRVQPRSVPPGCRSRWSLKTSMPTMLVVGRRDVGEVVPVEAGVASSRDLSPGWLKVAIPSVPPPSEAGA